MAWPKENSKISLNMKISKFSKFIWNEFVYGGHLGALVGVFIVLISSILINSRVSLLFLILLYLGCYMVYSFNRMLEIGDDILTNPERTKYIRASIKRLKYINVIYLLFFLLITFISKNIEVVIFSFLLLSLGIGYTLFFKDLTRTIIAFKAFFITTIWALLIPFYCIYHNIQWTSALTFLSVFLYIRLFIGINFFDTKDIESDSKRGLLTMGVKFGKKRTFCVLRALNWISVIPIIAGTFTKQIPLFSIGLLEAIPYTEYYLRELLYPRIRKNNLYYVIVNGESAGWLLSLLVAKLIINFM